VHCNGSSKDVFDFLASGEVRGMEVEEVDKDTKTITLKSPPSLLSWGEQIEVTVGQDDKGTLVTFRGSSVHPFNPTADVSGAVGKVINVLREKFGGIE
jgi:hypothetical protein